VVGDVRRRPAGLVQLDALVWRTLGWPGSRAAAIYAGMDQPSPHRLSADATLLADISEAEPALGVQVGELVVRRTPTLPNRGATLDAEPGETEVHETGAAAQQIADLRTAAMLIAVEPPDLIVDDVAARRDRAVATGHTGGDQPVVHRLGCNSELDRQSRDRLVVIDVRPHQRRHVRSANRSRHHPQHPTYASRRCAPNRARPSPPEPHQATRAQPTATFPRAGLTAVTESSQQCTPTTEISAVVPGQTWCQSEREAVRDPSAFRTASRSTCRPA
jgi:hypothetical protein